MHIKTKIIPGVLQAATSLLSPYVPELSPTGLMEALKTYQSEPKPKSSEGVRHKPYTKKEVADLLGLSIPTIDRMMKRGDLRRIYVGLRSVRIDAASIDAILNKNNQANA